MKFDKSNFCALLRKPALYFKSFSINISNVLDISYSLDPTNNSKPIDPDFREMFDQLCPFKTNYKWVNTKTAASLISSNEFNPNM